MKYLSLAIFSVCIVICGCSDTINGVTIAGPSVEKFYDKLSTGDFSAMYDNTAADFKAAITKDRCVALFSAIPRKLGKQKSRELANSRTNTYNLKTTTVLVYKTKYESGEAVETFTFIVNDGKAELIGYNINSLDMLIN